MPKPMPRQGGRHVRDPDTGKLTRAQDASPASPATDIPDTAPKKTPRKKEA